MTEPIFTGIEIFRTDALRRLDQTIANVHGSTSQFEQLRTDLESPLLPEHTSHSLITIAPHSRLIPDNNFDVQSNNKEAKVQIDVNTLVKELERFQTRLNEIIQMTTGNKVFKAQELLSLQAEVHRITQQIELMSKIVEQATSGIKLTLQTQV